MTVKRLSPLGGSRDLLFRLRYCEWFVYHSSSDYYDL